MLFEIPFKANWNKIGDHRKHQTDRITRHENKTRVEWDHKIGDKVLVQKDGIVRKTESRYDVILGPSRQFIQMAQSGFNEEQKSYTILRLNVKK